MPITETPMPDPAPVILVMSDGTREVLMLTPADRDALIEQYISDQGEPYVGTHYVGPDGLSQARRYAIAAALVEYIL